MDERYTEKKKGRRRTEEEKKKKTPQLRGRYTGRYTGPTEHLNFGSAGPAGLLSKREKTSRTGNVFFSSLTHDTRRSFSFNSAASTQTKARKYFTRYYSSYPNQGKFSITERDSNCVSIFLIVGGRPSSQTSRGRTGQMEVLDLRCFGLNSVFSPFCRHIQRFSTGSPIGRSVSQSAYLRLVTLPFYYLSLREQVTEYPASHGANINIPLEPP